MHRARKCSYLSLTSQYDNPDFFPEKIGKKIAASRFRANLLIDDIDPWKEFDWVGKKITIGTSVLEVFKKTQRCAATNVNPENAIRDINIPNKINSY